jgi:hypothetical protein
MVCNSACITIYYQLRDLCEPDPQPSDRSIQWRFCYFRFETTRVWTDNTLNWDVLDYGVHLPKHHHLQVVLRSATEGGSTEPISATLRPIKLFQISQRDQLQALNLRRGSRLLRKRNARF